MAIFLVPVRESCMVLQVSLMPCGPILVLLVELYTCNINVSLKSYYIYNK